MAIRRAQKKEERRKALLESAWALFNEKGYDGTTIEEITKGAACSPRTFFQYFASKEELLLAGMDDLWADLTLKLAERGSGVTTLRAMGEWSAKMTTDYNAGKIPFFSVLGREKDNTRISLQARLQLFSLARVQEILIPEIARDMKLSVDALEPRLVARATTAVFELYDTDPSLAGSDPFEFMAKAIRMLEGGMATLERDSKRRRGSAASSARRVAAPAKGSGSNAASPDGKGKAPDRKARPHGKPNRGSGAASNRRLSS